jgi:alpha-beta hydrolase superfamily lysophospholipase
MAELKDLKEYNLLYKRWGPDNAKAVFLLVYGLGAHSGRWEDLANFFSERGYVSYAIEL